MESNICPYCKKINRFTNKFCSSCGSLLDKDRKIGPRLVMLHGDRYEALYQLNYESNFIGRDDKNTVVLNDHQISKHHATILYENNNFWVEDTESLNGVYLNGRKVANRSRLFHGCIIKLGTTILRFETEPSI